MKFKRTCSEIKYFTPKDKFLNETWMAVIFLSHSSILATRGTSKRIFAIIFKL